MANAAEGVLAELAGLMGLDRLAPDPNGYCSLAFDDKVHVDIAVEEAEERLVLTAFLGRIDAEASARLCLRLLDANFNWQGTGGATLGVDRESGAVVQFLNLSLHGLDGGGLARALEASVNAAETWAKAVASPEERPPAEGAIPVAAAQLLTIRG